MATKYEYYFCQLQEKGGGEVDWRLIWGQGYKVTAIVWW